MKLPKLAFVIGGILIVGALALGLASGSSRQQQAPQQQPQTQPVEYQETQQEYGGYGFRTPFYNKNGISLQHYWPSEASFSPEETEILLFNDTNSNVQVTAFDLVYTVLGRAYPHKSGTWEKFATKTSWDRIEYINISPQYYRGQPLDLARGEKGKLHWHIQFGSQPIDGKQTARVNLTLLTNGQQLTINEQLARDAGVVVSKETH